MKLIITGSESFVGKEIISQCLEKKIDVVGIDTVKEASQDYEFHRIDIRDPQIHDVIPDSCEALIHLASLSRDGDCRGKAYECFDVNVMGTLNLIKAVLIKNTRQFIFASSEWVYDQFKNNEQKDEDSFINITNHTSEYALSKLVSENNLRQQFILGFCPTTILRFGIIYGPRKTNWSAVESILSSVKKKSEVTVGSLRNGRRFIHVSDIAHGIIKSVGITGYNIFNLTGNQVITIKEIIETSQRILDKSVKVIETSPSDVDIRNPSNTKAKRVLGWEPVIDLENGLKTVLPFV